MKNFYAIDLNDFYKNRKKTHSLVKVRIIQAKNSKHAKEIIGSRYHQTVWSVLSGPQLDKNVVYPNRNRRTENEKKSVTN